MHKLLLVFLILLSGCANERKITSSEAVASKQASEISEKCWKESFEIKDAYKTTASMMLAANTAVNCVMFKIEDQGKIAFKGKEYAEFKSNLYSLRKNLGDFFFSIGNENKYCVPSCGTVSHTYHYLPTSEILEFILAQLIYKNNTGESLSNPLILNDIYNIYPIEYMKKYGTFKQDIKDKCSKVSCRDLLQEKIKNFYDGREKINRISTMAIAINKEYDTIMHLIFANQKVPAVYSRVLDNFLYTDMMIREKQLKSY